MVPPESRGVGRVESHGTRIHKRSYQRCQRRLAKEGFAVYKGRLWTGATGLTTSPGPAPIRHPARAPESRRQRAVVFCWNAQSLTTTYVELLQWLHHQQISFALIQSTGWTLHEPWTSHGFHLIPSPSLGRGGGGLLTVVRTTVCHMDALSYQDWAHGRLQVCQTSSCVYTQYQNYNIKEWWGKFILCHLPETLCTQMSVPRGFKALMVHTVPFLTGVC